MSTEFEEQLLNAKTYRCFTGFLGKDEVWLSIRVQPPNHSLKEERWKVYAYLKDSSKYYYFADEADANSFFDEYVESAKKKLA